MSSGLNPSVLDNTPTTIGLFEAAHALGRLTPGHAQLHGGTAGPVQMRVGLADWAAGRRFGHITDAEHDQVIALLAKGDRVMARAWLSRGRPRYDGPREFVISGCGAPNATCAARW